MFPVLPINTVSHKCRVYNNKTAAPPLERPINRNAHRGAHTNIVCRVKFMTAVAGTVDYGLIKLVAFHSRHRRRIICGTKGTHNETRARIL